MSGLFNEEATVVVRRERPEASPQVAAGEPVHLDLNGADKKLAELKLYGSPLLNAASELLAILVTIPRQGVPRNVERFRQQILDGINRFRQKGLHLDYHPSVIDKSCFVLCAAFDEAVLYTIWGQKARWENYSLLSKVFSQRNGGEAFFTLLEKAKAQPAKLVDFLELEYVLLTLGFKGRYREGDENQLQEIKADVYSIIRYYRSEKLLTHPVTPELKEARQPIRRMHLFKGLTLTVIILVTGIASSEYWYFNRSEPFLAQLLQLKEAKLDLTNQRQDLVYISTDTDIGIVPQAEPEQAQEIVSQDNQRWQLVIATFSKREDAESLVSELNKSGYGAEVKRDDEGFIVVLAVGDDLNVAKRLRNEVNVRFGLNANVRRAQE